MLYLDISPNPLCHYCQFLSVRYPEFLARRHPCKKHRLFLFVFSLSLSLSVCGLDGGDGWLVGWTYLLTRETKNTRYTFIHFLFWRNPYCPPRPLSLQVLCTRTFFLRSIYPDDPDTANSIESSLFSVYRSRLAAYWTDATGNSVL